MSETHKKALISYAHSRTHTGSRQTHAVDAMPFRRLDAKMIARTRVNTGGYDNCWCVNNYWVPFGGCKSDALNADYPLHPSEQWTTQCNATAASGSGCWSNRASSKQANGIHVFEANEKLLLNLELNLFYLLFNVAIRHAANDINHHRKLSPVRDVYESYVRS